VVARVAEFSQLLDHAEQVGAYDAANVPEPEPAIAVEVLRAIETGNEIGVVFQYVLGRDLADVR
jgi:hypothetical protein